MSSGNVIHDEMPTYTIEERKNNMIVKLRNFRVYGDAEIKIPLNSVSLINGPSGAGKTTIFEAFIWIAYNGITSPERFETKNCWGWLFLGDTIVYRQKNPLFVKVWRQNQSGPGVGLNGTVEYIREEAEAEIKRLYGDLDIFIATSYLRQKEFSVFLGGTDAEKLNVMKTVAMKGSELDEIKKPIKAEVALLQENYTVSKAQLDMATSNISHFDQRNPNIVRYQVPENSEEVMRKVRELRDYMEQLDKYLEIAINREASANIFKQQVDGVRSKKGQIETQLNQINLTTIRARLQEIEVKLAEFSTVLFDAEKLAKAQMFKMWTQERERMKAKFSEVERDFDMIGNSIKKVFSDFPSYPATDISNALMMSSMVSAASSAPLPPKNEFNRTEVQDDAVTKALEFINSTKTKLEEIKSTMNGVSILLGQAGLKNVQEGKVQLEAIEKELVLAQEKEKSIRSELEKSRLSNKMSCPQCQTPLIMGEDGKHLEKCGEPPVAPQIIPVTLPPPSIPEVTETKTAQTSQPAPPTVETLAPLPLLGRHEPKPNTPTGIGAMLGKQPTPVVTQYPVVSQPIPALQPQSQPVRSSSQSSILIPTPSVPVATSTTTNSSPQIQFTHDDLAKAASNTASITARRDRIRTIISACEERSKIDYGQITNVEQSIAILPAFTKYSEYKLALDSLIFNLNDHNSRRPEEIKEKAVDTSEKEKLETERMSLSRQIEYHNYLTKMLETEESNLKQFTQMLSEAIGQGGANSIEVKKQRALLQQQIDQLMHLSSASDLIAQRVILEKVMRERMEHAQNIERMYMGSQRLLAKTVEAERIDLQSAVDEINANLSIILKRLFTNIPISVELCTTKALKSKKNQVSQRFDIKIFYNSNEYTSSKQLSGGEKDRLSLAITLALSLKYGSPFLFLDETLSSLDTELKSEAVAVLKEYCAGRTVICVSHEETEGLYDNVIRTKQRQ